jgi:Icc-related predicted phosphoesterase
MGRMRIAAVADLHGHLPPVPPCDLLVVAGDLCPGATVPPAMAGDHDAQAAWLDGPFRGWLDAAPATAVVGIAGNHDFVYEREPARVPDGLRWTYLEDDAVRVAGLTLWGSPWTPWFHQWAFNAPQDGGERFLEERYRGAPADTDVLVLHGPPAGYGDVTSAAGGVGSTAALALVDRVRPALCLFGHIHEGRGAWTRGRTQLANVAAVDTEIRLRPEPVAVFDV